MPGAFDPYHTWLGIPPAEQPPNHYRLLGLPPFEQQPEAIEHAADQRMAHLHALQAGKHGRRADKLLGEVAAARVCLLDPRKKAAYDRQLREAFRAEPADAANPAQVPRELTGLQTVTFRPEAAQAVQPGQTAAESTTLGQLGEYELLEKLGEGGMGTVYRAEHTKLKRIVALKVLPKGRREDERAIARFEREMKAVGRLDHPNIVRAHDAREVEGTRFLVMEYVEGLDLGKVVRRVGPLSVADACELIRQAALGLQSAHQHGLVHRDVKPSNLMLTARGEVKLLDLGLARFQSDQPAGEEMTRAGQAVGTPDYMAPEQISDTHSVDIRADIYSLGCTLYKLLTGQAPFSGPQYEGHFEKMEAHLKKPIPPIRQFRADVPPELVAVINRMLAKEPGLRFGTPAEVADAVGPLATGSDLPGLLACAEKKPPVVRPSRSLEATAGSRSPSLTRFLQRMRIQPPPPPPGTRQRRWRNPAINIASAAAGILLLLILVAWAVRRGGNLATLSSGQRAEVPLADTGTPAGMPVAESVVVRKDGTKAGLNEYGSDLKDDGEFVIVRKDGTKAPDGTQVFTAIQAAIDAVPANSVIEIQDSEIYSERVLIPKEKRGLTIRGKKGQNGKKGCLPTVTSRELAGNCAVLMQVDAADTTIEHLILEHVRTEGSRPKCLRATIGPIHLDSTMLVLPPGGGEAFYGGPDSSAFALQNCIVLGDAWFMPPACLTNCLFLGGETKVLGHQEKLPESAVKHCTIDGDLHLKLSPTDLKDCIVKNLIIEDSKVPHEIHFCSIEQTHDSSGTRLSPIQAAYDASVYDYPWDAQFADRKNLDLRLLPNSPCTNAASDRRDLGCRFTPEMIEMLNLARRYVKSPDVPVVDRTQSRRLVLVGIPDQRIKQGDQFSLMADVENRNAFGTGAELTFSLPNAPRGMAIGAKSGEMEWQTAKDEAPGGYDVKVKVESAAPDHPADEKSFKITVVATSPLLPIPDKKSQEAARTKLQEEKVAEYDRAKTQRHVALALAATLISWARKEAQNDAQEYVALDEARELATKQGDWILALTALNDLGHYNLDTVARKAGVLKDAAKSVPPTFAVTWIVDAVVQLAREEASTEGTYTTLVGVLSDAEKQLRRRNKTRPAAGLDELIRFVAEEHKAVEEMQALFNAREHSKARLQQTPNDGAKAKAANLAEGQFYCLVRGDWRKGLSLLVKGEDAQLQKAASAWKDNPKDMHTCRELGDAWWELARKAREGTGRRSLLESAARYWYESAAERLPPAGSQGIDKDINDLVERFRGLTSAPTRGQDSALPLCGVGGKVVLREPTVNTSVPRKAAQNEFASFRGAGKLAYGSVPASSYIHEVDLSIDPAQGKLELHYDEADCGVFLVLWVDASQPILHGQLRWWDPLGESYMQSVKVWAIPTAKLASKIEISLYVNENRRWLYLGGTLVDTQSARPEDLAFRVAAKDGMAATISCCQFRQWTPADVARVALSDPQCKMPPTKIVCDWGKTALRLHERNLDLEDHPSSGKSYVVRTGRTPMHGTPMQWVEIPEEWRKNEVWRKFNGFWTSRYEITQAEWYSVTEDPKRISAVVGSPFLPVDGVSWADAERFCNTLTEVETKARRIPKGYVYRLPTEAEWEHACGGANRGPNRNPGQIWCADNSGWQPHEVGERMPNGLGLYDMCGNVSEWCYDCWTPEGPKFPVALSPVANAMRVLRGGSWWEAPERCSVSSREKSKPLGGGHRGFRIVLAPRLQPLGEPR
jgi:serine/threonine protein kinase